MGGTTFPGGRESRQSQGMRGVIATFFFFQVLFFFFTFLFAIFKKKVSAYYEAET